MFTTNSGRFISYYGREHTLDIQRQDGNNPTISTIDQLFNVLLNVWCKETAYPSCQKDYDYDNDPTYGQCAITASLVYDLFDGTIYKLKVDGGGTHYFNKINGHYIDLTSDQFDLYDIPLEYVPNEVVPREYCGMNADTFFYSICKVIFQQKTACFHLISIQCVIHVCRHQHNWKFWIFFFNPHSCFQPIHPLHIDVQK